MNNLFERCVATQAGLEEWERLDLKAPALHKWLKRFRADKWAAARDYWQEIRAGILKALAAGPSLLPDKHQSTRPPRWT